MTKEQLKNALIYINKLDDLENLMNSTLETNEKFNLTAIKNPNDFRELMIYDSLLPLNHVVLDGKDILDVGTGAGFPGLPLAICSTGNFTLLDSTKKKIDYINEYVRINNINNVIGVSARAEDYAHKNIEKFDFVIARAVASLPILLELCIPMVKLNGYFLAMKSNKTDEEIQNSKSAFKKLNCVIENIYLDTLPYSKENRTLILVKKIGHTDKKYPRQYNDIKNKNL